MATKDFGTSSLILSCIMRGKAKYPFERRWFRNGTDTRSSHSWISRPFS